MKKRILFINGPLWGGGAERVLVDILRHFDYSSYDVDLAVTYPAGELLGQVPPQVNVIELWPRITWGYRRAHRFSKKLHCNWLYSRKLNGRQLRRDYDVEISFLEGVAAKLGALRTTDAPKVTWVHADIFTSRIEAAQFYPGEEQRCYDKMDVVVNVSKDCEEAFCKRFPDCKARKVVIYNPVDRERIVRLAEAYPVTEDDDRLTVITVGRLTPQKNPMRLLEVAALARRAGLPVRFKWIGDGELRESIQQRRDEMGLRDMVDFTGFIDNPFPHIKAADIMMITSDFEGFCLALCEAQCLGVPVISTRTAGPTEIIGDNRYGILTDLDSEAMFKALKALVDSSDERRQLAHRAMTRPDDFSVDRALSDIYSLIDNLSRH